MEKISFNIFKDNIKYALMDKEDLLKFLNDKLTNIDGICITNSNFGININENTCYIGKAYNINIYFSDVNKYEMFEKVVKVLKDRFNNMEMNDTLDFQLKNKMY